MVSVHWFIDRGIRASDLGSMKCSHHRLGSDVNVPLLWTCALVLQMGAANPGSLTLRGLPVLSQVHVIHCRLVLVRYQVLFDTDRYLNFVRYSILDTHVASLIFTENTVPSRNSMQQNSSIPIDILLVRYQNSSISIDTRLLFDTQNLPCKCNSVQ